MDEQERYESGLKQRRSVLGDAYVERSLQRRTEFTTEFQELITRYAWGEIWTRPGLAKRERSLVVLSMLIALNREAELRLHIRAARNNGLSRDEVKEVLLQAAIYCGVPAANSAFALAQEVYAEMDAAGDD